MRDINLLTGLISSKKQFDMSKSGKTAALIILLLVVLMGAAFGAFKYLDNMYTGRTDELRAEMSTYSEVNRVKGEIHSGNQRLASLRGLLDGTAESNRVKTEFFDTVGSSMNEAVFLTSLAVNENGTVAFSGKAATRIDITYFIYSLKLTGAFSDVTVSIISTENRQGSGETDAYNFSASAVLKEAAHNG